MKTLKIILGIVVVVVAVIVMKLFVFVPAEFKPQANAVENCPSNIFDKSAVVFNSLTICGTSGVSQDKLQHAANVAAQWLDNDQDGVADNPVVNEQLAANKATVVMSGSGFGMTAARIYSALELDGRFGQDLHAVETNNPERRDASQEEMHHIISGAGWAAVYPELFADQSETSQIYKGWEHSDANGYYVYNDPTCNNFCKNMEHLYKAVAAYLGSDADLADTEFTIKSQAELREKHPDMVALFESPDYDYPNHMWPDGAYEHTQNITFFP
ncbi:hypothetical protein [Halocynthiibacter namhaensis]|uniref:hypothetical protein n=1 Tax=Halocynthiibacter namhaensis TaxID=1290553 RepID=UPI00068C0391|nr:hypothetical protein [Halocynthiibacter namhaensis]